MRDVSDDSGLLIQVAASAMAFMGVNEIGSVLLQDIALAIAEEAMIVAFDIAKRYPELAEKFHTTRNGAALVQHVDTIVSNLEVDEAEEAANRLGDSLAAGLA